MYMDFYPQLTIELNLITSDCIEPNLCIVFLLK